MCVQNSKIGVVIPTYNGAKHLPNLLSVLMQAEEKPEVLVIDSSSTDDTLQVAVDYGVKTIKIDKRDFNHGATREMGRQLLQKNIIVMLTQDVIPASSDFLTRLIAPIVRGDAAVSYARQIPHDGAGWLERFPRDYNYPAISELRSIHDVVKYGAYTFFCSDSCAAWSNSALDEIGGFPRAVTSEDTIAAAMLLKCGYKIAYCADSVVKHSHCYTLKQEYDRYFVTGYVRRQNREKLHIRRGDEGRGASFVKVMIMRLIKENPLLIPYAVISCAVKLIGYRAGWIWNRLHPSGI